MSCVVEVYPAFMELLGGIQESLPSWYSKFSMDKDGETWRGGIGRNSLPASSEPEQHFVVPFRLLMDRPSKPNVILRSTPTSGRIFVHP